jgi:hypothetical protein
MFHPGDGHAMLLCACAATTRAHTEDTAIRHSQHHSLQNARPRCSLAAPRAAAAQFPVARSVEGENPCAISGRCTLRHGCPAGIYVAGAKKTGDSAPFSISLLPRVGIPGTRPRPGVIARRALSRDFWQDRPCRRHGSRRSGRTQRCDLPVPRGRLGPGGSAFRHPARDVGTYLVFVPLVTRIMTIFSEYGDGEGRLKWHRPA